VVLKANWGKFEGCLEWNGTEGARTTEGRGFAVEMRVI